MASVMTGKIATVFGGSGFLGRHVIRALAMNGWRVRSASRRPDLAGHLQPMGAVGQIHAVQANIRFPESIDRAIDGADVVVNLVSVLANSGNQTYQALNVTGARAVAKAAREAGCNTLIQISAIGADPKSPANYSTTKAEGERVVLEEFPTAFILRPSIVFGPEDEFFNRFASMAKFSPFLPLIGGGRTKFQPVYVGDIAIAIANILDGATGKPGTIYELGGPEIATFRKLLDETQKWAGHSRSYVPMPFWLAKLQAILTWPLPSSLRPITLDQVRMLQVDNIVSKQANDEGRNLKGLGISHPQAIGAIVPHYLEQYRPKGQYSHYRG